MMISCRFLAPYTKILNGPAIKFLLRIEKVFALSNIPDPKEF